MKNEGRKREREREKKRDIEIIAMRFINTKFSRKRDHNESLPRSFQHACLMNFSKKGGERK
jgi:hypothetical protein